jgi:hypothetical protein
MNGVDTYDDVYRSVVYPLHGHEELFSHEEYLFEFAVRHSF